MKKKKIKDEIKKKLLISSDDERWIEPINERGSLGDVIYYRLNPMYNGGYFAGGLGYVFNYLEVVGKSSVPNKQLVHKLFAKFDFQESIESQIRLVLDTAFACSEKPADLPERWTLYAIERVHEDDTFNTEQVKCFIPEIEDIIGFLIATTKKTNYWHDEVITHDDMNEVITNWRDFFLCKEFQDKDIDDDIDDFVEYFIAGTFEEVSRDGNLSTTAQEVEKSELLEYLIDRFIPRVADNAAFRMVYGF